MWKLLKYLLPLIVVAALSGSTRERAADAHEDFMNGATLEALSSRNCISETQSDLCLPRQITSGTHVNFQNAARRTGNIQRSCLEFTKAGKIINAGVKHLIRNIIIVRSALSEPSDRLFSLGRLII